MGKVAGASFHACKLPDPATKRTQFPGASVRATRPYLQGSWVVGPPSHQFQAPTQQWSAAIPILTCKGVCLLCWNGRNVGGPYHAPLWRWHSTEARQAVMTSQFTAIVWCMHGQRAVEQRPRIAAARGVSDTVSHWRTRTARNHLPAGPGCQRRAVFYGQVKREKAMTNVVRGSVGGPYHPPFWRCHKPRPRL